MKAVLHGNSRHAAKGNARIAPGNNSHLHKPTNARVVKLVDTTDLKSVGWKRLYRFDSGSGHHWHSAEFRISPQKP